MAAKKVTKPRIKWLKSCTGEPFSVECVDNGFGPPIVFVGEHGIRKHRDLQRLRIAVEQATKWLEGRSK